MGKAFEGKVVLVTGANGGIGEAAAAAYLEAGAKVYGLARRKEAIESASKKHPAIHWVLADVTQSAQVKKAIEGVVKEAGRLDVLVNNAAIFFFQPLEAVTEEQIRSQFEINVFGLTFASQAALPALKESKGSIVNISSAAGHKAVPGGSHYGATKAAVEALTRSWALELAPAGVRVNAIAPGPTVTPGFEAIGTKKTHAAYREAFVKQVPLGRMATSAEIAKWILAISDSSAGFITGEVLAVDGGMGLT